MKAYELPLTARSHVGVYGKYAMTAAHRIKAEQNKFRPARRIAIVQPGGPPAAGNACVLHVSELRPLALDGKTMDGLIFADEIDRLIFINNATGKSSVVELPPATVSTLTS